MIAAARCALLGCLIAFFCGHHHAWGISFDPAINKSEFGVSGPPEGVIIPNCPMDDDWRRSRNDVCHRVVRKGPTFNDDANVPIRGEAVSRIPPNRSVSYIVWLKWKNTNEYTSSVIKPIGRRLSAVDESNICLYRIFSEFDLRYGCENISSQLSLGSFTGDSVRLAGLFSRHDGGACGGSGGQCGDGSRNGRNDANPYSPPSQTGLIDRSPGSRFGGVCATPLRARIVFFSLSGAIAGLLIFFGLGRLVLGNLGSDIPLSRFFSRRMRHPHIVGSLLLSLSVVVMLATRDVSRILSVCQ